MRALIVGAGPGLSAAFARLLAAEGYAVVLAARDVDKLAGLARETGATAIGCDAAVPGEVASLFDTAGALDVVLYNPSARVQGPIAELDPEAVRRSLMVTAFGAFLVGQQAARHMLARGGGTILFTGASASVKGYPRSAPFAMGKFALRGLAQSMARELHPRGVHVAHIVVDGGIRAGEADAGDAMLDPDAIAATMLGLVRQHRSAWTDEIAVRPWVEPF